MYDIDEIKKKKLITRHEAAFYVGVSPSNMQVIMHSDGFPALVRIGKQRVFVHREKLDEWIDSGGSTRA